MKYYDWAIILSILIIVLSVYFISEQRVSLIRYDSNGAIDINALFSLEMPGTAERVKAIIAYWKSKQLLPVAFLINSVDYFIIFAYTAFFYFGIQKLVAALPNVFVDIKRTLLFFAFLPGILEFIENTIIFIWLKEYIDPLTPVLVTGMSIVKILVAAIMFLVVSGGLMIRFVQFLHRIFRHFVSMF